MMKSGMNFLKTLYIVFGNTNLNFTLHQFEISSNLLPCFFTLYNWLL